MNFPERIDLGFGLQNGRNQLISLGSALHRFAEIESIFKAPTQTVGLVARHLEANGIATVVIGSAVDIVERCGVPRFIFTDLLSAILAASHGVATCRQRSWPWHCGRSRLRRDQGA